MSDVNAIIFQTKKSKECHNYSGGRKQDGYRCSLIVDGKECDSFVLDLRAHLIRTHGLSTSDKLFSSLIKSSKSCSRITHIQNNDNLIMNPSLSFSDCGKLKLSSRLANNAFALTVEGQPDIENVTQDGHNIENDSQVSAYAFDNYNLPDMQGYWDFVKQSISQEWYSAIEKFSHFLSSVYGGNKTTRAMQMDKNNIFAILHAVGEANIFSCNEINKYISKDIKLGRAPSTSYSKIQSLFRFFDYVKYNNESLIPKAVDLDRFLKMLSGLKNSILKLRLKRNKLVMKRSREMFSNTLQTMSQWTESRNSVDIASIMSKYIQDANLSLSQTDFELIRGYFILEIIIPNGQRPGIVEGLVIEEINAAKSDIIEDVNRIFITEHKTSAIQPAVVFVYINVFQLLLQFVEVILPKLLVFLSGNRMLDVKTNAFLTYDGRQVTSSRVTPIFRRAMNSMGIHCNSSITDFRKASVSLTGKYCPEYHDIMSQFMCHSRHTHENTYKMNLGHPGLVNAFHVLHRMQKHPFQSVHEIASYQKLDNVHRIDPHSDHFNDSLSSNETFTDSEVSITQPRVSTPNNLGVFSSLPQQSINLNTIPKSSCTPYEFEEVVCDKEPSQIFSNIPSTNGDVSEMSTNVDLDESVHSNSNSLHVWKDCSINLVRHSLISLQSFASVSPVPSVEPETLSGSVKTAISVSSSISYSHHRSIFQSHYDESLFLQIFAKYIDRVSLRQPISKKQVISIAESDPRCLRLLNFLREKYPGADVYHKLYMKVRTTGFYKRRQQ